VKATKPPPTGPCIFCEVIGPLEGEHLLPAWTRGVLEEVLGSGYRRHRVFKTENPREMRRWHNPIATHKVHCVCYDCNHRWMKSLEERVKVPLGNLMRHGLQIIPAGDSVRRDLAAWAFKTAAVGQEMPDVDIKPIGLDARRHLYRTGEPPPNVVAWVSPTPAPAFDVVIQSGLVEPFGHGYVSQLAIGRICLSVFGSFASSPLPYRPVSVLAVDPVVIWPRHAVWSQSPTLLVPTESGRLK